MLNSNNNETNNGRRMIATAARIAITNATTDIAVTVAGTNND